MAAPQAGQARLWPRSQKSTACCCTLRTIRVQSPSERLKASVLLTWTPHFSQALTMYLTHGAIGTLVVSKRMAVVLMGSFTCCVRL